MGFDGAFLRFWWDFDGAWWGFFGIDDSIASERLQAPKCDTVKNEDSWLEQDPPLSAWRYDDMTNVIITRLLEHKVPLMSLSCLRNCAIHSHFDCLLTKVVFGLLETFTLFARTLFGLCSDFSKRSHFLFGLCSDLFGPNACIASERLQAPNCETFKNNFVGRTPLLGTNSRKKDSFLCFCHV